MKRTGARWRLSLEFRSENIANKCGRRRIIQRVVMREAARGKATMQSKSNDGQGETRRVVPIRVFVSENYEVLVAHRLPEGIPGMQRTYPVNPLNPSSHLPPVFAAPNE